MLIRNNIVEIYLRIIIIIATWAAIVSYSLYFDLFSELFIFLNIDFEMILFSKEFPLLLQDETKFILEDDLIYYSQTYKNITLTKELQIVNFFTYILLVPYLIQTQILLFYKNISYKNQYENIKIQMQLFFFLYYTTTMNITYMTYYDFIEETILEINEINPQLEYINFESLQNVFFDMFSSCQIFFITQILISYIKNENITLASNAITTLTFYLTFLEQLLFTDDTKNISIVIIYSILSFSFYLYTVLVEITNQIILVRKEGFEPSVVKHK